MSAVLSVCIIACNEERDLPRCLASVAFADDVVLVVDDRSTDRTEALARAVGARVFVHRYEGNIEQKNFALDQATGDWVLAVDADEAVSASLRNDVQGIITREDAAAGYELDRLTWHLGSWIRHGDFHPDWQLRLFRRGAGRWGGTNPHGRIRLDGSVERAAGVLEHYSYTDLADQVARIQDFSRIQARVLHAEGRRARVSDWLLRPPARFLRGFLLKGGFRDGFPGFAIATASAFHVFLKYATLWELERAGTDPTEVIPAGKVTRSETSFAAEPEAPRRRP